MALVALSLLAACSGSSDEGVDSSSSGGSSSSSSSGSSSGEACDPRPGSGEQPSASSSSSSSSGSQAGIGGGTIDPDSGTPFPPDFRTPCVFSPGGADPRTNCTDTGDVICCEKKSVCYEPAREPTFCDRPYCE